MTSTPLRPTRRLRGVVVVLAALLLGGLVAPVGAQEGTPTDPPVVHSWAVTPTGANPDEPSSRPALSYTADPGSVLKDSVTLWNYSNVQLTFRIYATDAFNNADGAFDLLAGDEEPEDVGTWITLPQGFVTVPAASKIDLPIELKVPAGASPGDHAGAILASNQAEGTGPDGKAVPLDRRTGTRLYVRVGGPLRPSLAITKASSKYDGSLDPRSGELAVTYTVRNVGNVRLGAEQAVAVRSILGKEMASATPPAIEELLPGNEVTVTERFSDIAATVRVSADIDITPIASAAAGDEANADGVEAASRTAGTWAFPWLLLLVALVLVATVAAVRRLRDRARGGRPGPGPGTGEPSIDPQVGPPAADRVLVP